MQEITVPTTAGHEHVWQEATCLTPKTCSVCNAEEGEPLGHHIIGWTATVSASCQSNGLNEGTCTRCDATIENITERTDHIPGAWKTEKEATLTQSGKRTKTCTVCNVVLESQEFELSEGEREPLYKEACQKYSYEDIARAPGQYNGKFAKFTGEVVQVQQETLYSYIYYILRVNVTKKGTYSTYYTDTIYVTYIASASDPRILEDDIITMYGKLTGEKTYTTVMGASVTIPSFTAEYIDIQ